MYISITLEKKLWRLLCKSLILNQFKIFLTGSTSIQDTFWTGQVNISDSQRQDLIEESTATTDNLFEDHATADTENKGSYVQPGGTVRQTGAALTWAGSIDTLAELSACE